MPKSTRSSRHPRKRGKGRGRGNRTSEKRESSRKGPGGRHTAIVEKNRKGFAFLAFEGASSRLFEDVFLPREEAEEFFHGDRVSVTLTPRGEVRKIEVLSHRFREILGRFVPGDRNPRAGWVIYQRKNAYEEIYVPRTNRRIQEDHWVLARLKFKQKGPHPVQGEIVKTYGARLPAIADIEVVSGEFDLREKLSREAIREAEALEKKWKDDEAPETDASREDLTGVPFVTIDGPTARDFDDAVFVEKQRKDFILWVAIADVSHFVQTGTPLDKDARERATSVYFPERAFHMLPSPLSENLCSLKPNVKRFAMVLRARYDSKGRRKTVKFYNAVIRSRKRWTYEDFEKKRSQFKDHYQLYDILWKKRKEDGALDLELPEPKIDVDSKGEPQSLQLQKRLDSHRLIEAFMVAANEAVAETLIKEKLPGIFRIHEKPDWDSFRKYEMLSESLGVRFTPKNLTPLEISKFLRKVSKHPAAPILHFGLLRALKQASYDPENLGHFGLASRAYLHFTSPIRRYADLVVHRVVKGLIARQAESKSLERNLPQIAEHCSHRDRIAAEAERECYKMKQVRYLERHLGENFQGMITGVSAKGLFIQVTEPYFEGTVPVHDLGGDYFRYSKNRNSLVGRRTRRSYHLGDRIKVQVTRTNLELRSVELRIVK